MGAVSRVMDRFCNVKGRVNDINVDELLEVSYFKRFDVLLIFLILNVLLFLENDNKKLSIC